MNMNEQYLDKRHRVTIDYLESGRGEPIYKRSAYPHIRKVLGPVRNWVHLSAEEYFSEDEYEEARQAMHILSFNRGCTLRDVKQTYRRLSQGNSSKGILGWHPDVGGHCGAFAILNHAYNIFKGAE